MSTLNQLSITNSNSESSSLRIDMKNVQSIASAVLNSRIKYKTLEIVGDLNNSLEFIESESSDTFWRTMGVNIVELVVVVELANTQPPVSVFEKSFSNVIFLMQATQTAQAGAIFDNFLNLKKLTIDSIYLHLLSSQFYAQNKRLEVIEVTIGRNYSPKFCIAKAQLLDWVVLPEFENIFKNSVSLNKITFPCWLPYNGATFSEATAYFSQDFFPVVGEVKFEFEFLTFDTGCYITEMEIEIVRQDGNAAERAAVKVIDIEVKYTGKYEVPQMSVCIFEHSTFTSNSVQNVSVVLYEKNICLKCLKFMMKSFPNCRRWVSFNLSLDPITVTFLANTLVHLADLQLSYSGKLELWPDLSRLRFLKIKFDDDQSADGLFHLSKCCQNLEEFSITFSTAAIFPKMYEEAIVASIAKHVVKLKHLELDPVIYIGSLSLQTIRVSLKQLKTLSFGYRTNPRDLFELFKDLPQLESIDYKLNSTVNTLSRQDYLYDSYGTNMHPLDPIEILPEGIWSNIFERLHVPDQMNCRRVCKSWWNVLHSYPNFARQLTVGNCVLAHSKNPIKTFIKSQFNWNRLLLEEPLIVCNENFSEFWQRLGTTIKEICFGLKFTPDTWVKLVDCGMTIEHFPSCKAITFNNAKTFFDFISYGTAIISPILKNITKLTATIYTFRAVCKICPDIPNLEFVKLIVYSSDSLRTMLGYLIGHCPNVHTLYIHFECRPVTFEANIKIDKTLNVEQIELSLNNWKGLTKLIIHASDDYFLNVDVREMAIRFYKILPKLTVFLCLSSRIQIRYELETAGSVHTKSIVERKCGYGRVTNAVVYTERTNTDM